MKETQAHVARLEEVFGLLEEKVRGKHCEGIAGIIEEGKSILEEDFEGATLDACLIAAGQRAEHYEMAAYGTLVAWARTMNLDEAAELLEQTLEEEKAADEKLSKLAESGINENAFDAASPNGEESEPAFTPDVEGATGGQGQGQAPLGRWRRRRLRLLAELGDAIGQLADVGLGGQLAQLLAGDGRLHSQMTADVLQHVQHGRHLPLGEQIDLQVQMPPLLRLLRQPALARQDEQRQEDSLQRHA